jgi:16S rRNA (uracil1498-N3)-methyltransferase
MPAPYFYEPQITTGATNYTCSEETSKHCAQVLRMQSGDALTITNGMGSVFEATILVAHKKNTSIQIIKEIAIEPDSQKLVLGISILKNAVRLEWLFEKATEMGVHSIIPLLCERTIHERFKTDRMKNIIQSAMIQSQQAWLPYLSDPISYKDFIHQYNATNKYIAHCEPTLKKSIKELPISNDLIIAIGPEGDFTPSEIEMAVQANYQAIGLGPTRLRTETAGLFALSVLKTF